MSAAGRGGVSIFWQTLLLLLASLITAQIVSIGLFLSVAPPRPDFNRLSDLSDALEMRAKEQGGRDRALIVTMRAAPPDDGATMIGDPLLTARLAERLDVAPGRVRLFYEPDQRSNWPGRARRDRLLPMRRGEPIFFNTVVAAIDTGQGWRVVQTRPRPWIASWQKRAILWFAVSALVLLPFAWVFARRLALPIRRIADAADRMGSDPLAPRVPEEGPSELRVTAHALNGMQERLAEYVAERTAMIGAIAHDLRTPLARIAFRIEDAPDTVRDKVQADIEQMRQMISATIGFVRGATLLAAPAPVALTELLEGLVAESREMGLRVTLGETADVAVLGDRVALGRLFQNLIDNGVAYGGEVAVSVAAEGGHAVVRVADRGPGLDPAAIERLFHPFERGDPSRSRDTGGIGLGLTIARSIAQAHGGTLTLANRDGGGIVAMCTFPLR